MSQSEWPGLFCLQRPSSNPQRAGQNAAYKNLGPDFRINVRSQLLPPLPLYTLSVDATMHRELVEDNRNPYGFFGVVVFDVPYGFRNVAHDVSVGSRSTLGFTDGGL